MSGTRSQPASTADRARELAGYDDLSSLRQSQDYDWVLDQAPAAPRAVLDLGTGTGALLDAALARWPEIELAVGIDASPARVAQARDRLRGRALVEAGDIVSLDDRPERFDLVMATSVLHWTHPRERRLFGWVARHLAARGGSFLLTTHHPHLDRAGVGAEDLLARAAFLQLGEPFPDGLVPMSTRARADDDVRRLLEERFEIAEVQRREVAVTAASALQYERFHAATFGTYFAAFLPADKRDAFFSIVGREALRRTRAEGCVYSITVRLWHAVTAR